MSKNNYTPLNSQCDALQQSCGVLSSPVGLQEWFADKVDEWEGILTFSWGSDAPDKAKYLKKKKSILLDTIGCIAKKANIFEFRISKTEISNQTVLMISDFAEKSEIKDATQLWDYQVKELFHRLEANI